LSDSHLDVSVIVVVFDRVGDQVEQSLFELLHVCVGSEIQTSEGRFDLDRAGVGSR
jgi:hypothetical protein